MPPYETPIPGGAVIGQQYALAKKAYEQAIAQLEYQRQRIMQEYGYTAQFDPNTGDITSMAVDPWNPYGNYQALLQTVAGDDMSAEENRAARRLSPTGLGQQDASRMRYQHEYDASNLGSQFADAMTENQFGQQNAELEYARVLADLKLAAAQSAVGAGDFNPAQLDSFDYSSLFGGGGSSGGGSSSGGSGGGSGKKPGIIYRNGKALVLWGGKYRNKSQMIAFLKSHGVAVKKWIKNNPKAAKALGIGG